MNNLRNPRLTHQSLKVLQTFMKRPVDTLSGADVRRATKLWSGTLYPILIRFENAGLLTSDWEEIDPSEAGRPRRRLYKITGHGIRIANEAFSDLALPAGNRALA